VKLAAIDIGSNSIKLAVVDAAASDSFAVLSREKEVVRLAHHTLIKGHLSQEAIERAASCIKHFKSIADARGAETIVAVATASIREAKNSARFIKEIEQKTMIRVEVLSGIEEARLIGLAASRGCGRSRASTINIDIGGGSTELSLFRDGFPISLFSVRLGAVGLTEQYLASNPPRSKELNNLRTEVRSAFERPARQLRGAGWQQATGTSGTILAIGRALRSRNIGGVPKEEQEAQPAEAEIGLGPLSVLNSELAKMRLAQRRSVPGLSPQRSEIIVAGGQILEGAMRSLGINALRTCDWALREGVIIDHLREWEDESRPVLADFADQKLRGVDAVGRRFGYEANHAHQVARLAGKIFDSLASGEGFTRHHRTLMLAGALLHDVGYHIANDSHHKHSLYLIANSELTGFSESERAVIANIARYHRGPLPKNRHPEFAALNTADRETVCRLGAIVRLADALDRSHDSRIHDLDCRLNGAVSLELHSLLDCESELLEAERKKDLFEQTFQRSLILSVKRSKVRRA
jgi:exopolyphosphatase/guanosine-5'-triphosphate,3'-diphosphate pyrophosphatase